VKPRRGRTTHRRWAASDADARLRLEALFTRIDRLIPDDLAHAGLAPGPDDDARAAARSRALDAAEGAGLGQLVDDAVAEARERVLRRWTDGLYRPSWVGMLNWGVSLGRAADRLAVVAAIEDAALAAVVDGMVDPDDRETLALDADHLLGLATGGPAEESLATALRAVNARSGTGLRWGLFVMLLLALLSYTGLVGFATASGPGLPLLLVAVVAAAGFVVSPRPGAGRARDGASPAPGADGDAA
jgi:hypothetical protein